MTMEDLRKAYGEEYPTAVVHGGVRMELKKERRFSRVYAMPGRKYTLELSRFDDGSASVTLADVREGWPAWSDDDRLDFCGSCSWLSSQADFPDILRFVMAQGDLTLLSSVASSAARQLPQKEAFDLLCDALGKAGGTNTANITQAIAHTGHPDAEPVLRAHLDALWASPDLWDDDPFPNWRAYDATCCIAHLLKLGASPPAFEEKVRRLFGHPCEGNRSSCSFFLHEGYDWLPAPQEPPWPPAER
jgi:hypothetical protein